MAVDRARLDHACRTIALSVSRTRQLFTEWTSDCTEAQHPLAALAGSWGEHTDDEDVLREIYASRWLDAE